MVKWSHFHYSKINLETNVNIPWEVDLPDAFSNHNLLKINDTHLVLVDGFPSYAKGMWMHELGTQVNSETHHYGIERHRYFKQVHLFSMYTILG